MIKRGQVASLMIVLAIIILLGVVGLFYFVDLQLEKPSGNKAECNSDSDCVPATCCHPDSCAPLSDAPDCSAILCTANCQPETLDCNQGSCNCVNKKCTAVFNE